MLTKNDSDALQRIANLLEEIRVLLSVRLPASPAKASRSSLRPNEWRDIDG